jgi:hypothetical protein
MHLKVISVLRPHHDLAVPFSTERELVLTDPLAVFRKTIDRQQKATALSGEFAVCRQRVAL